MFGGNGRKVNVISFRLLYNTITSLKKGKLHACSCFFLRRHWFGRVIVEVEVDFGQGLPGMAIVGLPDAAVQESRERVHSAIKNAGLIYPRKRVTVNLAPASVRKEGPAYDLPIALGVLVARTS